MGTNDNIQVSQLNVPMKMRAVGCFDDVLYGLVYNQTARQINRRQQIDLVKFSISSGTYVQEPTVNWQIVEYPMLLQLVLSTDKFCCVGRQVFFVDRSNNENKYKIVSLDLDTKKWQRTSFEFPRTYICMHNDGERTLIVTTHDGATRSIHRFVYNQPDKLSDLVWLRLKRIFDARPSSYEFILSQLPKNFKQKCPF
ncbi:hypothetical protein M3Y95_01008900 [Aphelenchoides besseyi]|nr:hypothetical protein M3Y95_01008900 [Aphelenchoides besseyi]